MKRNIANYEKECSATVVEVETICWCCRIFYDCYSSHLFSWFHLHFGLTLLCICQVMEMVCMEDTMAFMEEDMGVSYLGVKAYNPTTHILGFVPQ